MDTKQGLFSTLKDDLMKGLLPASGGSPISTLLRRRKKDHVPPLDLLFAERCHSRPQVEAMSPLKEGPEETECSFSISSSSDLRLLLGVLAAPLAPLRVSTTEPFPHLAIKDIPIETSSAQYILQQYIAASGELKLQDSIYDAYAMGNVRMIASEFETANTMHKFQLKKIVHSEDRMQKHAPPASKPQRCAPKPAPPSIIMSNQAVTGPYNLSLFPKLSIVVWSHIPTCT
ncbi:unnamed protein product [Lathyrus sativus]|nr:unnamed protein product [Lathyrus sativus]